MEGVRTGGADPLFYGGALPTPPGFFPSAYNEPWLGGPFNPYYGGFGHWNHPFAGAGYLWPGFTYPFNFQAPFDYALQARFVA